jgi:hypothetical protein
VNALAGEFDRAWPLTKAAYRSWSSMKTGVMVWLWFLNLLYWVAFAYWPRAEAVGVIVAYLAVGPLILWSLRRHRGLTRLSGLIHVPWVPFAAYLGLRLFSDQLGPRLSMEHDVLYYVWLQAVFFSTVVCLAFDAVDVVRWIAGERYVLGTPAAAAAGASKLARQD